MTRKKTNEEFLKEVHSLVDNEYSFLEPYQTNKTKIKVKHNKCGTIYEVKPLKFLQGNRCPNCYGTPKKTTQQFKEEVYSLVGNEYSVLGKYVNSKTKIKVKHNKCNSIYQVKPTDFLEGVRCPNCYGTPKKTTQQFKEEVYDLVGNEYSVLDEYINAYTKIRMKHNKCGTTYKVVPSSFIQGRRCPNCAYGHKLTTKEFAQQLREVVGNEYELISECNGSKSKVDLLHKKCGEIHRVIPNDFINHGSRCSCERTYKGEDKIKDYLDNHSIKYEQHKKFDWLNYQGQQHLDFYLEDYNLAIEYDGVQHFELVNWNGNLSLKEQERNLKDNILRDKNKDELLKEHSINLLRISYIKFDNINNILDEVLYDKKEKD